MAGNSIVRSAVVSTDLKSFREMMVRLKKELHKRNGGKRCPGWLSSDKICIIWDEEETRPTKAIYNIGSAGPRLSLKELVRLDEDEFYEYMEFRISASSYSSDAHATLKVTETITNSAPLIFLEFIDGYSYNVDLSISPIGPSLIEFADYIIQRAHNEAPSREELISLRKQLKSHHKNLLRLDEEIAKVGFDLKLLNLRDNEKMAIEEIELRIQELEA